MRKKLLMITSLFPNPRNMYRGIFVLEQAKLLAEKYDVRVIAYDFPGKYELTHFKESGIPVDYFRFPLVANIFPTSILTFAFFLSRKIKRVISSWEPDLIQYHDFAHLPGLWVMHRTLQNSGIPCFLTLHNLKSIPGAMNRRMTDLIYRTTMKSSLILWTKIYTVSRETCVYVRAFNPRCEFIGNGIVPDEAPANIDALDVWNWFKVGHFKFISVGNLVKTKGFDLLIPAIKELNAMGLLCQLVIVGDGPEREQIRQTISDEGLSELIFLHSPLPHSEVMSLYSRFDAFVLPSWKETFGIVYLEAMFAGLPVIAVKCQGISGLFEENDEALFCEPLDKASLIQHMRFVIEKPGIAAKMAEKAREKVRKSFMLRSIMERVLADYAGSLPDA